ncbi:uncharacterized protein LOC143905412 [Temnothorax americanus]|uniref:uncharacterized protein LOC143905412 n=1 Tax=Temnothorax americanus TaxID=1964332 RepID=UPI00406884F8
MSVNKFGMSLTNRSNGDGASTVRLRSSIESLRNYARNNALFVSEDSYDARERKIRRVAAPEDSDDATNRSYVEDAIERLRKVVTGEIEKKNATLKNDALRLDEESYDARERKIRRLAAPEVGADAANRSFVEGAITELGKTLSDVIKEFKKEFVAVRDKLEVELIAIKTVLRII